MRPLLVLLLTFCFLPWESKSQPALDASSEFMLKSWRTEHGLPHNSVTSIAQTKDGYLWCGTRNGLVRFDGVRFTLFNRLNSPGLLSNSIKMLAGSEDGSLLIVFEGGEISRMKQGQFETLVYSMEVNYGEVNDLLVSAEGALFLATARGLYSMNIREPKPQLRLIKELEGKRVVALSLDKDHTLWIGAANGLWRRRGETVVQVPPKATLIDSVAAGNDGSIWMMGPTVGLLQLASGSEIPRRVWNVSAIGKLFLSKSDEFWLIRKSGELDKFSSRDGIATTLRLGTKRIHCLFEDREGNIWVGTEDGGLVLVRKRTVRLYHQAKSRPNSGILSVTGGNKGEIWAAGENGNILTWGQNQLELLPNQMFVTEPYIEAVLALRNGGLLAGSRFDGLYFWNGNKTESFQKISESVGITSLFEDRQGRLWIASSRGGVLLKDGGDVRQILSPDGGPFVEVTSFAQALDGRIWIGTRRSGLAEWLDNQAQWQRSVPLLNDARIECLYLDQEGDLWIGTNRGLVLRRGGRFFTANTQHGLYDDVIYQILEDSRGNLWMGSNRGIFRVAKIELEDFFAGKVGAIYSIPHGVEEGLGSLEGMGGRQPTAAKSMDGKLWFATQRGLAVVDPGRHERAESPPVMIEEIKADGVSVRSANGVDQVIIPAGADQVEFNFTALTFVAPEKTQFRYQLEGVDKDWVRAHENRVATYAHLPPGNRRFEVMARIENGNWESSGTAISLYVQPTYWQTAWFKGVIIALAVGFITWMFIDRAAKKNQMDAVRQQITRDLHDDLGSNLGSIALLSEALQKPGQHPSADRSELLSEINLIARQTLEAMTDAVWFVNPEKDSAGDLVQHLRKITESMLKSTPHLFEVLENHAGQTIPLKLKRGVVLVFKETLHNVIKHSQASMVRIEVSTEKGAFRFEVHDNGRGFDLHSKSQGHGLKNLQHRTSTLGGKLTIESSPGQGTAVRFQVKLS